MATQGSAVQEAADLLRSRLKELDSERSQLERALASLTDGREGKRGPGRPRGSARATAAQGATKTKRRRRRRGGTRSEQAVKLITDEPGLGASEIAKRLGIKPNYMYRVLTDLQKEGQVRKEGRAYHPASAGS